MSVSLFADSESIKGSSHYYQVHGIRLIKRNHPDVMRLIADGYSPVEFGSRIWRASYLLIDYLSHLSLLHHRNLHVLELGCGWGLPSIFAKTRLGMQVTASDIDSNVFAFQDLITQINGTAITQLNSSLGDLCESDLHAYDMLMGADICYSATHARLLEDLIANYAAQRSGCILLADSGRAPFFNLVDKLAVQYCVDLHDVSIELPIKFSGYVLSIELPY